MPQTEDPTLSPPRNLTYPTPNFETEFVNHAQQGGPECEDVSEVAATRP